MLVQEFKLTDDPGLIRLAQIVHAADLSEDADSSPEGRGLYAIAHGFAEANGATLELSGRDGGGTRARLALPAVRVPAEISP